MDLPGLFYAIMCYRPFYCVCVYVFCVFALHIGVRIFIISHSHYWAERTPAGTCCIIKAHKGRPKQTEKMLSVEMDIGKSLLVLLLV